MKEKQKQNCGSPASQSKRKVSAFISYAREDSTFVSELDQALRERGIVVKGDWLLEPGPDYTKQLRGLILSSDVFLFIISPHSVSSQACAKEVDEAASYGKRILPVLRDGSYDESTLHPELLLPQWTLLRTQDDTEVRIDLLANAINTDFELMKVHSRLLVDAENWASDKDKSSLLRGTNLKKAEEWLSRTSLQDADMRPQPTQLQRELIAASRKATQNRLLYTYSLIGIALIVAVVTWLVVDSLLRRGESRRLSESATSLLQTDRELSLLLAIEAYNLAQTAEAESVLRRWVYLFGAEPTTVLTGHSLAVTSASFSPDGQFVVTSSVDKTARVWEAGSGHTKIELIGHADRVTSAMFSPDGQFIVTASEDSTVRIWDRRGGPSLAELRGHKGPVNSAAFSPDGNFIVTAGEDKTARIWEVVSRRMLSELHGHTENVYSAAFSQDGQFIITASADNTARVWEVSSKRTLVELRGHSDALYSASFSYDGKTVITASKDKTARIWETSSGRTLIVLQGHKDRVKGATYSHDGRLALTASWDKTARVWDVSNGQALAELGGYNWYVNNATFSPDDRFVVTASVDRTARIYPCEIWCSTSEDFMRLVHARVKRKSTPEERQKYMLKTEKAG